MTKRDSCGEWQKKTPDPLTKTPISVAASTADACSATKPGVPPERNRSAWKPPADHEEDRNSNNRLLTPCAFPDTLCVPFCVLLRSFCVPDTFCVPPFGDSQHSPGRLRSPLTTLYQKNPHPPRKPSSTQRTFVARVRTMIAALEDLPDTARRRSFRKSTGTIAPANSSPQVRKAHFADFTQDFCRTCLT